MANITQALLALAALPQAQNNVPQLVAGLDPTGGTAAPPIPIQPSIMAPLSNNTTLARGAANPEPVPPALPPAVDADALLNRYFASIGPAPTPPPEQKRGVGETIALALQALAFGAQGQGRQFLEETRQRLEEPQRRYEARLDEFNRMKAQAGFAGVQAVTQAETRRDEIIAEQEQRRFESELKRQADALGFTRQEDIERLRGVIQAKNQADSDERQSKLTMIQLDAQDKRLDKELAAVEKRQDKEQAFQLRLKKMEIAAARAAVTSGAKIQATIIGPDGKSLGTMPYTELARGGFNQLGQPNGFPAGSTVRLSTAPAEPAPAEPAPTAPAAGAPNSPFAGPYVQPTPITSQEIQEWRAKGVSEGFIKAEIQRRGLEPDVEERPGTKRRNAAVSNLGDIPRF